MRKLARPVWGSFALTAAAVVGVVVALASRSPAQENTASPPPAKEASPAPADANASQIEVLLQQVKESEAQSKYDEAAKYYQQLLDMAPVSMATQDIAVRAGRDMEKADHLPKAVAFYDRALMIAETRLLRGETSPPEFIETVHKGTDQLMKRRFQSIEVQAYRAHYILTRAKLKHLDTAQAQLDYDRKLRVYQMWKAAQQLEGQSLFAEAAQRYRDLMAPENRMADNSLSAKRTASIEAVVVAIVAGQLAARNYEKAGNLPEAIACYDQILSLTETQRIATQPKHLLQLQKRERFALRDKARACYKSGRAAEARQAVQRLKTNWPEFSYSEFDVTEARLGNANLQEPEQRYGREQQADEKVRLAQEAWKNQQKEAVQLLDDVINDYDDTPAAIRAASLKGQIIRGQQCGRRLQANAFPAGYGLAKIKDPAPESRLTGSTVTFSWTSGKGVEGYYLKVGSSGKDQTPGFAQYFDQVLDKNTRSVSVAGLPTDGSTVYVRLYSQFPDIAGLRPSIPKYHAYVYVAQNASLASAAVVSEDQGKQDFNSFSKAAELASILAPESRIAQSSRYFQLMSYSDFMEQRVDARGNASNEEWDRLRAICSDVIEHNPLERDQIAARFRLLESYVWGGDPAKGLEVSEGFLRLCETVQNGKRYKWQTTWAHHITGVLLAKLKRYNEALKEYQYCLAALADYDNAQTLLADDGGKDKDSDLKHAKSILMAAYYRIWRVYVESQAPQDQVARAGEEFASRFPNDSLARILGNTSQSRTTSTTQPTR